MSGNLPWYGPNGVDGPMAKKFISVYISGLETELVKPTYKPILDYAIKTAKMSAANPTMPPGLTVLSNIVIDAVEDSFDLSFIKNMLNNIINNIKDTTDTGAIGFIAGMPFGLPDDKKQASALLVGMTSVRGPDGMIPNSSPIAPIAGLLAELLLAPRAGALAAIGSGAVSGPASSGAFSVSRASDAVSGLRASGPISGAVSGLRASGAVSGSAVAPGSASGASPTVWNTNKAYKIGDNVIYQSVVYKKIAEGSGVPKWTSSVWQPVASGGYRKTKKTKKSKKVSRRR